MNHVFFLPTQLDIQDDSIQESTFGVIQYILQNTWFAAWMENKVSQRHQTIIIVKHLGIDILESVNLCTKFVT